MKAAKDQRELTGVEKLLRLEQRVMSRISREISELPTEQSKRRVLEHMASLFMFPIVDQSPNGKAQE